MSIKERLKHFMTLNRQEQVIDVLLIITRNDNKLQNELINLSARSIRGNNEKHSGASSNEEYERNTIRITHSILNIIDRVDFDNFVFDQEEVEEKLLKPVSSIKEDKKKYYWIFIGVCFAVVGIMFWQMNHVKEMGSDMESMEVKPEIVIDTPKIDSKPEPKSTKNDLFKETIPLKDESIEVVAPKLQSLKAIVAAKMVLVKEDSILPFRIAKYETTVGEYLRFCQETNYSFPEQVDTTDKRLPVTYVSWYDAKTYCSYVGGRLPTVEEWEFVAKIYQVNNQHAWISLKDGPKSVGQNQKNSLGLFDMLGNVREWCKDESEIKPNYKTTKGGDWKSYPNQLKIDLTIPYSSSLKNGMIGFRVAFSEK